MMTIDLVIDMDCDELKYLVNLRKSKILRYRLTVEPIEDFSMTQFMKHLWGQNPKVPWPDFNTSDMRYLSELLGQIDEQAHEAILDRIGYEADREQVHAVEIWYAMRWRKEARTITAAKTEDASKTASECLDWAVKHVEAHDEVTI